MNYRRNVMKAAALTGMIVLGVVQGAGAEDAVDIEELFYTYSSEEEVKEYYNIRGNIPFINDLELSCIPFNKIDSVLERVVEMEEISDYVFKNALNKYIAFIA